MLIDEILSKFIGTESKTYYSFETFILNLLKYHLEQQQKVLVINNDNLRTLGDAIAEDGLDDIIGKTIVEIKLNLDRTPPKIFVDQFFSRFNRTEVSPDFKNILIINGRPISRETKERILIELNFLSPQFRIILWGPEELNKIVTKHKKEANKIANNLFALRLENIVSGEVRNWEDEREERIELLIDVYKKRQFSAFLGAGVSSSAGMPDWNTLLNSLFVSYLAKEFKHSEAINDNDIKQIVHRLNYVDEPSALMAARYLRKGLTKEQSESQAFINTISDNLYKLRDSKKDISSKLIKAITNLCMPTQTGARVKSVITYNFDDLLERELETKAIRHHSIYKENELSDPDELPIYHVHGFLPEDKSKYTGLEEITLVFSEEGYHQIYSDAYHWSNLVQLYNLRENSCLMIGLSLTDPNLRRLLEISARNSERPRHFAFMKRLTIEEFCYEKEKNGTEKKQVINNKKAAEQFLNGHHKLNEELMKELGVLIIWYTSYDDIPTILTKVNNE
ncbi:SIR2 family protein [Flavobacterium sp. WV_118_3]|uniref:SIR2 family protein n=1 Tax=Flavobacterium sp. WV_118_3 TaxID=3151764 RepID=UPI003219F4FD